jgi:Aspartyl protease
MPHGSQNAAPGQPRTHVLLEVAIFLLALMLRLVSVAECPANTIHFTSPHRYMIVIPVRINGTGPYSFLLDTGATSSAIDPKLSTSLHLSAAKGAKVSSWEGTIDARRVLIDSLSLGPVDSGPLTVLVQPLSEFKAFEPHLRGVIGQDVLLHSNYLIDNRHHLIQFDYDGELLHQLAGDRISIVPVRTRSGALEPRLIGISVRAMNTQPLELLLDSGADMVVLQPLSLPPSELPRGSKWMSDENGTLSSATTFHTRLSVGSEAFSAEAWIGNTGLKQLVIDGLLPTGSFDQLYIGNQGSFVIFDPGRIAPKPPQTSDALATSKPAPLTPPDIINLKKYDAAPRRVFPFLLLEPH